jgi:hypothetical protein
METIFAKVTEIKTANKTHLFIENTTLIELISTYQASILNATSKEEKPIRNGLSMAVEAVARNRRKSNPVVPVNASPASSCERMDSELSDFEKTLKYSQVDNYHREFLGMVATAVMSNEASLLTSTIAKLLQAQPKEHKFVRSPYAIALNKDLARLSSALENFE